MRLMTRSIVRVVCCLVLGVGLVVGLASAGSASGPGREAKTTVTITGKVEEIGATKAKGSCAFTGTRDGKPVSGDCSIVFKGKQQTDGTLRIALATVAYAGTGAQHRLTARGNATIRFPTAPTVDLGPFTFHAEGRGSSFVGGTDDGNSI